MTSHRVWIAECKLRERYRHVLLPCGELVIPVSVSRRRNCGEGSAEAES